MSERYDVIFTGLEPGNPDAKVNLAKLFKVDVQQLEANLAQNDESVISTEVSLEIAKKHQAAIVKAGGRCRYQPSKNSSDSDLELVPKRQATAVNRFKCAACEYTEVLEDEKATIKICPQCGVIPEKYEKVKSIKEERELVKRKMQAVNKHREDTDEQERQRIEDEKRRKVLEKEVCEELGIPRYLTSRIGIFSSAALMFLMGISLGAGGVLFYHNIMYYEDSAAQLADAEDVESDISPDSAVATEGAGVDSAAETAMQAEFDEMSETSTPSQQAMMQVAEMTEKMGLEGAMPVAAGAAVSGGEVQVAGSMGNTNVAHIATLAEQAELDKLAIENAQANTDPSLLKSELQAVLDMELDPGWDLSLMKVARLSLQQEQLDAEHVNLIWTVYRLINMHFVDSLLQSRLGS